ncbi:MAG: hypothetical protein COA54_08145 [Thiotrichaceae bacterium]|nr:MAG: hypothetical protein COA54_08145 [Thiotrichaceae bacterium]
MLNQEQLLFQQETTGGLVEVWQQGNHRWLNIDAVVQSGININQPELLVSPLHHAFLAAVLFIDMPEKILLAGMGAGAFARYIHHINPAIEGDAVEINKTISVIAKQYFDFPDKKWKINIDNIRQWQGSCYDYILADIAQDQLTPAWLTSEAMLLQLKNQLSEQGVLVMNLLVNDAQSFHQILITIRKVFKRKTLCLTVPNHKNVVIFAFNNHAEIYSSATIKSQIVSLTEIWGIDFEVLFEQLKNDNPVGSFGGIF